MAIHSSILDWKIPWTKKPGGQQSTGSQTAGHDWVRTHVHTYCWLEHNEAFFRPDLLKRMISFFLRSSYRRAERESRIWGMPKMAGRTRTCIYVGGEWARETWLSNLALPFINSMTWDKLFNLSESFSLVYKTWVINTNKTVMRTKGNSQWSVPDKQ